jgi:glycosyl transferase family 2
VSLRVTAILAAFNEEDIIGRVVEHLTRQGIGVHLLDDGSTDATVARAEAAAAPGLLEVEALAPPTPASERPYRWAEILQRKTELAATLSADWFLHYDADELRESPWPGLDLRAGIERVDALGFSAIQFEVLNFWPTRELESSEDATEVYDRYAPAESWDAVQVKAWKAQPEPVELAAGGHEVRFPGRRVFPLPFLTRHYPLRGEAHARRKVFQERITRFLPEERERGWHVHYDRFAEAERLLWSADELLPYDHALCCADLQDRVHTEGEARLAETQGELGRTREVLSATQATLAETQTALSETQGALSETQSALSETQSALAQAHAALDQARTELEGSLEEQARMAHSQGRLRARFEAEAGQLHALRARVADLEASASWRVTSPLRAAVDLLHKVSPPDTEGGQP